MWTGLQALSAIVISAACTFFMRALPFLFLNGKRKIPKALEYLGKVLPSAIMAVLIIYCCKTVPSDFYGTGWAQIVAVCATGIVHVWKKNTYFSILVGTAIYMILIRI